jgi:hypothetical protein
VGVATGASGGLPAARCTSNGFLCAISAACGNQQKKRHAFMELFHLGWRDSLGIKNPAFWCISVRTPPALHRFVERCMGGSGIRSAVGAVVGLCSRWEAGDLLQRACGAMGVGDCTVEKWGFYPDPVSPEALFDFFTGNLADW